MNELKKNFASKENHLRSVMESKSETKTMEVMLSEHDMQKQMEGNFKGFRSKMFQCRNSVLTDLWENKHIKTIYNFGLAVLIIQGLCLFLIYYFDNDKMTSHLSLLAWLFGKFHIVCYLWFAMMASVLFCLHQIFRYWAFSRHTLRKAVGYDLMFLSLYVALQFALIFLPGRILIQSEVPMLSSCVVTFEQIRLTMKCHSFVRENAPKALKYKPHQDGDRDSAMPCPEFEKILFFLFAPTLIYRDCYPRTSSIQWGRVIKYFSEIFGCCFAAYMLVMLFIEDTFKDFCKGPIPLPKFIGILASSVITGTFLTLLMFYGFFHSWLNAWAEMLKFGDRMFYQDWWTATSCDIFYKRWNTFISDWLYSYVYMDICLNLKANTGLGLFSVFFVSALAHEYIMSTCLNFVCPLIFIWLSVFSVIAMKVFKGTTSSAWNVLVWILVCTGNSSIVALYSFEWFARINNPETEDSWQAFIAPRSYACFVSSLGY